LIRTRQGHARNALGRSSQAARTRQQNLSRSERDGISVTINPRTHPIKPSHSRVLRLSPSGKGEALDCVSPTLECGYADFIDEAVSSIGLVPFLSLWCSAREVLVEERMQESEKRSTSTKVKKGWLAVRVGLEEDDGGCRRFMIPISYLYHPQFSRLLEAAQEAYGYHSSGPLKLPCSVDDFLHLRWLIERESQSPHGSSHHHRPQPHHSSLSLYSC
ncbi:hypothetical protein Taro_047693, partial [Colocasia esculenta]|nr:hypothetical protein [Colocasia esculenta]